MAESIKIKQTDEELLAELKPEMDLAKGLQDELASAREDYYSAFRMKAYGNERDGWAQSISPVIWNHVQWQIPSLMEIFHEDCFTLRSKDEERAENFRQLLKFQMFRKHDGYRKFYDFFFDAELYHYAVFKVYKKDDYDIVVTTHDRLSEEQMLQLTSDPDTQVTKFEEVNAPATVNDLGQEVRPAMHFYDNVKAIHRVVTYSGACFEVTPPWEFFFSPDSKLGDWGSIDGRCIYHEVKRNLDYIRKKEKSGAYRKGSYEECLDLVGAETANFNISIDEQAVKSDLDDVSMVHDQAEQELLKELRIQEVYYKMDIDNDGLLESVIITLAEKDVILSIVENPYGRAPFRIGSIAPEPHKILGVPMPSVLDNDQKVMTNLLRLIQDGAAMSIYRNPVTPNQNMFLQLQNRKPFAVIKGDPNQLGEIKVSDPGQFILKAYELMQGEREEKTGISRYNQGLDADSLNKTATGIQTMSNASSKRLRMIARLLGNGPLMGVLRDFIYINQKWPPQMDFQKLGIDIRANQNDLDGNYEIEIDVGVGPGEKQSMANQLDLLIQFGTQAGIPMGIMEPIHILRAQKRKGRLLDMSYGEFFIDEQELKRRQQIAAQQQAAAAATGQQPGPGQPGGNQPPGQGGQRVSPGAGRGQQVLPNRPE